MIDEEVVRPRRWLDQHWDSVWVPPKEILKGLQPYGHRSGNGAGIYFLGLPEDIGYVGKAQCIRHRMWQHKMFESKNFTHWFSITTLPWEVVPIVEAIYIDWLDPPINIKREYYPTQFSERVAELKHQHPWPPADYL